MTISESYSKLIALSRFAPDEVVSTKELKAQRFEQGLPEEIQLGLGGETFSSLDIVYGRVAHIYVLQSRHDKKNVIVAEKRKGINNVGNQGNFKKNRNGNGNFQGKIVRATTIRVNVRGFTIIRSTERTTRVETIRET